MVLASVLALLAIAAAIVHLMLGPGENSVARSQRFGESAQALALLRAGEQSAIAALWRDMVEAPETDHNGEPWAAVAQAEVDVATGTFALAITDAQGRINLNALSPAETEDFRLLMSVADSAGLSLDQVAAILATLEEGGPIETMDDLSNRAGLKSHEIIALSRLADTLPGKGPVNINTAPVEVIAAVMQDPALARAFAKLRARRGFLSPEDIDVIGGKLPAELGFRSTLFRIQVRARVGETQKAVEALLQRRVGAKGPEVVVVSRRMLPAGASPIVP